jgi:hypothetical protein
MLNAFGAYQQLIAGQGKPGRVSTTGWDLNQLDKRQTAGNVYKISLPEPTDKIITATVVWNRHYNSIHPFEPLPEKDGNLRLELWAVNPIKPDNRFLIDYSDSSVDNVEHIYCQAVDGLTNYELVVSFSGTDAHTQLAATEIYGLAWNISDSYNIASDEQRVTSNELWYDLNADGIVNELDFAVVLDNSVANIKSPEGYLLGDVNGDGTINMNDLQIFMDHKNRQASWYQVQ